MAHENCKEIFALLSEHLDAELPQASCEEIEKHLAGCPPCLEFLESLKRTVGLCRGYNAGVQPRRLSETATAELRAAYQRMLAKKKAE